MAAPAGCAAVRQHAVVSLTLCSGQAALPRARAGRVAVLLRRSPWRHSSSPPSVEPDESEVAVMSGELASDRIWKPPDSSVVTSAAAPCSSSTSTRTEHRRPAAARGSAAGWVRHSRVPVLVLLASTSHEASAPPSWRRLTRMRAGASAKPSPVSRSVTPPAALPCAAPPPPASAAAVTLSGARTAVSPSGWA